MFFDVLQVFVLFLSVYTCRIFDKPAVSDSFCLLAGIPFPVTLVAQNRMDVYAFGNGSFKINPAGERIRGNSLIVTMCPVLHTGQRHGFIPVSLAKRSVLVSGSCCFLIIASMSGFFSSTNCRARFRLVVWL